MYKQCWLTGKANAGYNSSHTCSYCQPCACYAKLALLLKKSWCMLVSLQTSIPAGWQLAFMLGDVSFCLWLQADKYCFLPLANKTFLRWTLFFFTIAAQVSHDGNKTGVQVLEIEKYIFKDLESPGIFFFP